MSNLYNNLWKLGGALTGLGTRLGGAHAPGSYAYAIEVTPQDAT